MANSLAIRSKEVIEVVGTKSNKLTCGICDKTFSRKYNFDRHSRVHKQKVTNLVCSECLKTFANAANLKTHLNDIHNGKTMELPRSALVTNKGIAPVKMVDASTQTDTICDCRTSDDGHASTDMLPRGMKWKDSLYVRYKLKSSL